MIHFSAKAIEQIRQLMDAEGKPSSALRVGVKTGGCSGQYYYLGFQEPSDSHLRLTEIQGLRVIMDEYSESILEGVTLDYESGLHGKGFVFRNLKTSHTCACNSGGCC